MGKYWALRIAAAIVPLIPRWLAEPTASAIGLLMWAAAGETRRRVERNLRHVPTVAGDPRRLRWATRGVFRNAALNYLDFLRGPRISNRDLLAKWAIENDDLFLTTMGEGRGLIILSGHFGNFELGASRLGALGYNSVTPAEHMRPEELFQLFCRLREHHRMRIVAADSRDSLRELLEALKRGEIVIFLADRYVLGASMEAPFFGEPAKLPTGPIALALRSGAPVMAVSSWREPGGRRRGRFVPLELREREPAAGSLAATGATSTTSATGTATRTRAAVNAAATERALRLFVAELEKVIAAHPEQWVSALAPIWDTD